MFEIIVGVATIGSFVVAIVAFRSQKRTGERPPRAAPADVAAPDVSNPGSGPDRPAVEVPEGITFGHRVALVPGLQQRLFTHSGRIEDDIWRGRSYSWITRGEVIGRYHMDVPKISAGYLRHFSGTTYHKADIRSPVSGLVLHTTFSSFVDWPAQNAGETVIPTMPPFAVLMPDDEPAPEGNGYIFRDALTLIQNCRAPLFQPSRYWSMDAMDDEQFSRLLNLQKQVACIILDALPRYQDYLEEARTRYPSLRPHLKHLQ